MKAKFRALACVAASLVFLVNSPGQAEIHIEPIPGVPLLPPDQYPGNVFERFFPEEYHPEMEKILTFEGSIQNIDTVRPAEVLFWFDWVDPRLPGSPTFASGIWDFTLTPSSDPLHNHVVFTGPTALTYTIPFCPPEVSIHFVNDGPGGPVIVSGTFTHECVPEPWSLLILPAMIVAAPLAARRMKTLCICKR